MQGSLNVPVEGQGVDYEGTVGTVEVPETQCPLHNLQQFLDTQYLKIRN